MRHRWQTTSVWALVAYFGALSLLGPGWHCAFGDHFHCAVEHCSTTCEHGHCHTTPANHTSPASSETGDGHYLVGSRAAHDCPLCQFFGIAQWSDCFSAIEFSQISWAFRAPASESPRPTFVSHYRSRGPPLDACI